MIKVLKMVECGPNGIVLKMIEPMPIGVQPIHELQKMGYERKCVLIYNLDNNMYVIYFIFCLIQNKIFPQLRDKQFYLIVSCLNELKSKLLMYLDIIEKLS